MKNEFALAFAASLPVQGTLGGAKSKEAKHSKSYINKAKQVKTARKFVILKANNAKNNNEIICVFESVVLQDTIGVVKCQEPPKESPSKLNAQTKYNNDVAVQDLYIDQT